jgi:4-hydroxy-tetrahydrodipicolinate synthase
MHRAKEAGADIAVVGPPFFLANDTLENIIDLYMEAVRNSPLPVGIYDRGRHSQVVVPCRALEKIYAEPNVVLVKDSSLDTERMKLALAVRKQRQGLYLLNGYEFDCISYLEAGYDGLLLGGGIFNGHLARQIFTAVRAGHAEEARHLQERMNRLMWDVYGGKDLTCWLAGEKELLVQMGVFSTTAGHLRYPLTKACVRAIRKALKRDADVLFPESA